MKSIWLIVVLAIVDLNCTLSLNQTVFMPLSVIATDETGTCLTQQQRDTALDSHRNKIASFLTTDCGGIGWTRVAYLNMSDPTQSCPPAWRDRSANGVRVCGRPASSGSQCHGTFYSTSGRSYNRVYGRVSGRSYNRVCGRVIGYQFGHTDAFHLGGIIDQLYVDGVSITHGNPRSHIWTLAAGISENDERANCCPCNGGQSAPPFVGKNYYCESGYNGTGLLAGLLTSDSLWDGAGCESEGSCCSTAPWFTVDLVSPTSDDIEVRICANNNVTEDSPIHLLELYIQ